MAQSWPWGSEATAKNIYNKFSKSFWMVHRFYGLWYTLPASFVKYWTEVMKDLVLNSSSDAVQFFPWYCVNNVLNLGLVISWIYDLRKWIFENYDYFVSFQLNIRLEKGYQAKLLLVKCSINLTSWTTTSYPSLRNEILTGTQILLQICCLY